MQYFRIYRKLVWLAIALLTCFFVACYSSSQETLKVGANIWPGDEPLYLARDLGYFDDVSIKIIEYSAVPELERAFQNGAIDMSINTLDRTLLFAEQDPDIRVWLLTDFSDGADAVVGQPEIKDLKDLKGRTIGLYPHFLSKLILFRALQSIDLTIDNVKQLTVEANEQERIFANREIDALITSEPYISNLQNQGGKIIFDSQQMPREIIDLIIGHKDLNNKFRKELQILVKGWFQALQYIQNHPDDAMRRMAERQGISTEQFSKSLEGLSFVNLQENQALLSGKNPELYEGVQQLSALLIGENLMKQTVIPNTLFDDSIVKNIKP
ncbi:MAG: ABC transporter substrate-binding protein [Cyanobacteria bacterium SBLK]|nr:ABC transporter substrate-binding protein [Cyanobacteria bacterium SBLK]